MKYLVIVIIYARLLTHSVCSYVCLLRSRYTRRAIIPVVVIHTAFLCSDFPIWHPLFIAAALLLFQDPVSFYFVLFPLRFLTSSGKISEQGDGVAQGERECTLSEQAPVVISFSAFIGALVLSLSCLHAANALSDNAA